MRTQPPKEREPTIYGRIEGIAADDGLMNGKQFRIAVIDITEREKAESILERYQLISKYARDIILLMDRDGHIIEANEAAINAYGYTPNELLSKNISDLRATETLEKMSNQKQRLIPRVSFSKPNTSVKMAAPSR